MHIISKALIVRDDYRLDKSHADFIEIHPHHIPSFKRPDDHVQIFQSPVLAGSLIYIMLPTWQQEVLQNVVMLSKDVDDGVESVVASRRHPLCLFTHSLWQFHIVKNPEIVHWRIQKQTKIQK